MKLAFIIFNDITSLDLVGIYDPVCRLRSLNFLPDLTWDICGFTPTVTDNFGLEFKPNRIQSNLSGYDAIIIPGGFGTRNLQSDRPFMNWIKTAEKVEYKISICTGSLILGAAGFLKDKRATTHFDEYEILKPYCKEVLKERIVDDGKVITAGAVSSSLDLGLYLCNKWAGEEAEQEVRKRMDYRG